MESNCEASCTTTHNFELLTWDDAIAHLHYKVCLLAIPKSEIKIGVKRKAVETPNEKPAKVICSVLKGVEKIMSDKDLVNLRKSINRERLKTRPPLPKNIEETFEALKLMQEKNETVSIDDEFGASNLSIHVDENNQLVLLYTQESITALCTDGTIHLGDGTFKFCPKFFAQVYTLHASLTGVNMHGVYVLLK